MKKLLLLLLLLNVAAFAQGTSQKEYNYLSKGYKDDLDMGKDIISGYSIAEAEQVTTRTSEGGKSISRTTIIYKLIRTSDNKIAGFLFEEKRLDTGAVNYLAIPNASADIAIWSQAQDAFLKKAMSYKCELGGQVFAYNWNNLRLLSKLLSN